MPFTRSVPVLKEFSFDAQKEAVAILPLGRLMAFTCASVIQVPSTVSLPPFILKVDSSVFTLRAIPGAERKV